MLQGAMVLPPPSTALAVAAALLGVLAWVRGSWGLLGRRHFTLMALAALLFAWQLSYWNLMLLPF
jgi:hypothetical protein